MSTAHQPAAGRLSAHQVAFFRRCGWLRLPAVFSGRELLAMRWWIDEVATWPVVPGGYLTSFHPSPARDSPRLLSRIENLTPYHEAFAELVFDPRLRLPCTQLLGGAAALFQDALVFNPPGAGATRPIQHAAVGWTRYAPSHVTALVAVEDCTLRTGCIHVASGGAMGILRGLGLRGLRYEPVECSAGDLLLIGSRVAHGWSGNRGEEAVRAVEASFNLLSDGDHRERYYADRRRERPPDPPRRRASW